MKNITIEDLLEISKNNNLNGIQTRILMMLALVPCKASDLRRELYRSSTTIYRWLYVLETKGLIVSVKIGNAKTYFLQI